MNDWISIDKDDVHVTRERAKARELKKSLWWKQELAKGVCHYCKEKVDANALTMDHIIPVVRGGKSTRGNVVTACHACNAEKKYLTPAERVLRELEDEF